MADQRKRWPHWLRTNFCSTIQLLLELKNIRCQYRRIQEFDNVSAGKKENKKFAGCLYKQKKSFFCVLYTHSQFLCTLARFDLANRGVRQPVQRTLSMLDCLYFEKLLSKNKANVADRLATLGSTNALKVLKRKQWKRWWLVQRSGTGLSIRWKFNHIISLIHENHCSSGNNKTNEKLLPSHLVEVKNK